MLRFHGSYQLDQMDNREVFQLLLLVCLRLYLFLILLVYVSNKIHKIYRGFYILIMVCVYRICCFYHLSES